LKKKYSVILENWGNIDYRQDPNAPVCIGGYVFEGTKQIASISYNGRIWEEGSEYYHVY